MLAILVGACVLSRFRRETWTPAAPADVAGRVIFRKAISGGREIIVRRGRTAPISTVDGLFYPVTITQCSGVFPVRVELSNGSGEPLVLWSRLDPDFTAENLKGLIVLDLMPDEDGFVMATAQEAEVILSRVHLAGTAEDFVLKHPLWSREFSVVPLDETCVKLVLGRSADGKAVTAEIHELREPYRRTTLFQQVGESWEFKPVKQSVP